MIAVKNNLQISKEVLIQFESPENQSYFFGYYNYSPLSKDGTKLLAHKSNFEGRMPNSSDIVEIGYFDLVNNNVWCKISISRAFNWQQGSNLQWLGPDCNTKLIFNDVEEGKFVSRIIDLASNEVKTIDHPIYAVSNDGKYSISLNYERCYWTRAYSYAPIVDETWNSPIPEKDGLVKVNLQNGEKKTILYIKDFLKLQNIKIDHGVHHWFEHVMFNPSCNRVTFYYRYGNQDEFKTRVFTADVNGKNIWEHPLEGEEQVTHLGWKDDKTYVLFTRPKTNIRKLITTKKKSYSKDILRFIYRKTLKSFVKQELVKKIVDVKSYYALTQDQNKILDKINFDLLSMDGHPTFTKDGNFMLTDTYQDKENFRTLMICDLKRKRTRIIGRFYSTYNNCGWRADLHPRFSHDEKSIIIDSTHNGYHQMLVLRID